MNHTFLLCNYLIDIGRWNNGGEDVLSSKSSSRGLQKKTVSFCSTSTSGTYKTAPPHLSDGYTSDSSNTINAPYDTDYFSPDEDDDEFFDLSPSDDDKSVLF